MTRVIATLSIIIFCIFAVLLNWGMLIEPRLVEEVRLEAEIPGLPQAWEGKTVAFIADMQVGMPLGNTDTLWRIIKRIIAERPALVLIGGDFIYHPTEDDSLAEARAEFDEEEMAETRILIWRSVSYVAPLVEAGLPVYAVFGNHDYAMETESALKLAWVANELEVVLERAGIQVLRNESVALQDPGGDSARQALHLVGVDAYYPGEANVHQSLADLPPKAPRLVLMHNPQSFSDIPAGEAPLALSGHTHGGQIRIPGLYSWSWLSIVREHEVHTDGWIKDFGAPGNRLYVNRGIGFSIFPVRIHCLPELTWITLRQTARP
ncbi:MAG: metallophosphoesterase [Desulfocurvibacter africanus]